MDLMEKNNGLTDKITITRGEYDALKSTDHKCELLISALIDTSELSYNKESIVFDDEKINFILNLIEPYDYSARLRALKEAEKDE